MTTRIICIKHQWKRESKRLLLFVFFFIDASSTRPFSTAKKLVELE